jgi:DNA gyrase subunit A
VRGIRLAGAAQVVSLLVVEPAAETVPDNAVENGEEMIEIDDGAAAAFGDILTATERGFGKRTALANYPCKGRGTQGVIAIQCSERNGNLVGAVQLDDAHELMLISNQGTLVRTRAAEIARVGRNTQGVTLIRLPADEALVGVVAIGSLGADEEAADADASAAMESSPPAE